MIRPRKTMAWAFAAIALTGLFFSENIRGYMRFRDVCQREAGPHVFHPLQPDVGWTVLEDQIEGAGFPMSLNSVAFVRYRKREDARLYDVYRSPMLKVGDPGYAEQLADPAKPVVYQFNVQTVWEIPKEVRIGVQHFDVTDLRTGQLAFRYSRFSYSKFDPHRTILGAPSGEGCPEDIAQRDPRTGMAIASKVEVAFVNAFAK